MKRKFLLLFLCLFLCLFLAGCGSTEPEETEEETPVVEAVPETPAPAPVVDDSAAEAEAAAKAEAAKKEAAAKAVADAREAAVKAGAADLLPDELQLIDEKVAAILGNADYEAASKEAVAWYKALEKAAKAIGLYNELVDDEYDVYAPESFAKADAAIDEVIDLWEAGADVSAITAKIDEAYTLLEKTKAEGQDDALVRRAAQLEKQAKYFRDQVVETSAADRFADYLAALDDKAAAAKARYEETHDYDAYKAEMDEVILGYKMLVEASLAEDAYWKIYNNDWEDRDPDRFDQGWAAAETFLALTEEGSEDMQILYNLATVARENWEKIVNDASKNLANAERDRYNDVKKKADEIKANVAAKTDYAAAAKLLIDGDASASRGQWGKALDQYKAAADAMTEVYETVSEKRTAAQEAIERAKQRAAEAAELAAEADEIAPLSDEEAM